MENSAGVQVKKILWPGAAPCFEGLIRALPPSNTNTPMTSRIVSITECVSTLERNRLKEKPYLLGE